jgi:hypothetical protein
MEKTIRREYDSAFVVLGARGPACKQGDTQPCDQRVGTGRFNGWLLRGLDFANKLLLARGAQMVVETLASSLGI